MNGNMYETALAETWELFADYACGSQAALVCVVSGRPLGTQAQQALDNSMRSLGYGSTACTFVVLCGTNGNMSPLDPRALFLLIEGFDPVCLIAADEAAASALQAAYRCPVPPMQVARAFGRTVVVFRSFENMLVDAQQKQRAWALLKQLPRRDEI